MKIKKNIFIIINSVIPLIIGLGIYIFMKNGTHINTIFNTDYNFYPQTFLGEFIVNWLCDFLWSYSLVFTLYFFLQLFLQGIAIVSVTSFVFSIMLEFFQKFGIWSGTFDWWDIVIETVAIIFATIVLKVAEKKIN